MGGNLYRGLAGNSSNSWAIIPVHPILPILEKTLKLFGTNILNHHLLYIIYNIYLSLSLSATSTQLHPGFLSQRQRCRPAWAVLVLALAPRPESRSGWQGLRPGPTAAPRRGGGSKCPRAPSSSSRWRFHGARWSSSCGFRGHHGGLLFF